MADTFTCPHCNAVYPIKPVLIGRAVRCTSCKAPFKLQPDGIAIKLDPTEISSSSQTVSQTSARAKEHDTSKAYRPASGVRSDDALQARKKTDGQGRSATRSSASSQTRSASGRTSSSQRLNRSSMRLTVAQERTRRLMSSTLSTAAMDALESSSVKAEEKRATRRLQRSQSSKTQTQTAGDGAVAEIGPAVLTGEGENEAKQRRTTLFVVLGLAVAAIIGWFVMQDNSPERMALRKFVERDEVNWSYPYRKLTFISRMWLEQQDSPIISDIDNAHITKIESFSWGAAAQRFSSEWANLSTIPGSTVLVDSGRLSDARGMWQAFAVAQNNDAFSEQLTEENIRHVSLKQIRVGLAQDGMNAEAAELFTQFLQQNDSKETRERRDRLLSGDIPSGIELAHLQGNGYRLIDTGEDYRAQQTDYTARMLRFDDSAWRSTSDPTEGWKVLDIQVDQP